MSTPAGFVQAFTALLAALIAIWGGVLFLYGVGKLVQDVIRDDVSETSVVAVLAGLIVWAVGLLADRIAA